MRQHGGGYRSEIGHASVMERVENSGGGGTIKKKKEKKRRKRKMKQTERITRVKKEGRANECANKQR